MSMKGNCDVLCFVLIHFNKKGTSVMGFFSSVLRILIVPLSTYVPGRELLLSLHTQLYLNLERACELGLLPPFNSL